MKPLNIFKNEEMSFNFELHLNFNEFQKDNSK